MEVIVQRTPEEMSRAAAREVANVLNAKPNAVLGMATGSTPLGLYVELVRMHKRGELDFSHVTTFNLDEHVGLPITHPQSYHQLMHENFFRHINIPAQNIHIPSGTTTNYPAFSASALQMHPSTRVYVDEPAASKLKMREYYDWIQEKKPGAPAHERS